MGVLLYRAVDMFFYILYILIFIRVIISWLPISYDNGFFKILYSFTEPILGPIRNMMNKSPLGGGLMIDFSPIIALFIMNIVKIFCLSIITSVLF